jgi:hypothetical protein
MPSKTGIKNYFLRLGISEEDTNLTRWSNINMAIERFGSGSDFNIVIMNFSLASGSDNAVKDTLIIKYKTTSTKSK